CTFSIASGFSSWLLITPLLLMRQRQSTSPQKWWIIWVGAFLFEALAYFYSYEKPANHPSLWWPVAHPGAAGAYVLVFLGSPFAYGTELRPETVALWMGGLLVLILLACAFYIWSKRNDRDLLGDGLPWLMLAMVAVTTATLTMIGRSEFG